MSCGGWKRLTKGDRTAVSREGGQRDILGGETKAASLPQTQKSDRSVRRRTHAVLKEGGKRNQKKRGRGI